MAFLRFLNKRTPSLAYTYRVRLFFPSLKYRLIANILYALAVYCFQVTIFDCSRTEFPVSFYRVDRVRQFSYPNRDP